jgi:hypothetical protein
LSTKIAQSLQKQKFRRLAEFAEENIEKIVKSPTGLGRRLTISRGLGRGLNENREFGGAVILWRPMSRISAFREVTVPKEKKVDCGDNSRITPFWGP